MSVGLYVDRHTKKAEMAEMPQIPYSVCLYYVLSCRSFSIPMAYAEIMSKTTTAQLLAVLVLLCLPIMVH